MTKPDPIQEIDEAKFPRLPILLVDDEAEFLLSESVTLNSAGITHTVECQDSRDVMSLLSKQEFQGILMDMSMPHLSGWKLLPQIVENYPNIPVVVITAIDEVETAVQSMKTGAFDYLVKPVDDSRLVATTRRAIELREIRDENVLLKRSLLSGKLEHPEAFSAIVTRSSKMRSIFQYLEAISRTPLPVLITGDTGVGKELIARALHALSGRKGDLVPVNVAGVDDNLFSDTLFGHKRGGFTGADRDRKGLIEQASGGSLFLDEIGDLGVESQVKRLRLLQEGKYYPIGADVPKLTDARFIVAANRNLDSMQQKGEFRKDLYYRLRAHHIHIPPLTERKEDIPLLTEHFLEKAAVALGKKKPTPPRELLTLLENYHFPGNIRELEGMIYDAVSQHKSGVLSMESLRGKTAPPTSAQVSSQSDESQYPHTQDQRTKFTDQTPTLKEAEQLLIAEPLKRSNEIQTMAAKMLGMTRRALTTPLTRTRQ